MDARTQARRTGPRGWVARHPVAAFFAGAFLISWISWTPAMLGFQDGLWAVPYVLAGFGPLLSAAAVTRLTGGSVWSWLRRIFRVRLPLRWYAAALLLYPLVPVVATLLYWSLGQDVDTGLLPERLAAYLPTLVLVSLLLGGNEEPGWRGFALPRLQDRMAPWRASLLIGALWAPWHVPVLISTDNADHDLGPAAFALVIAIQLVGIAVGYSTALTYLWNRTGSIVPCILLHATYNTSNGLAGLQPEEELVGDAYLTITITLTGTLVLAMLALILATRGRLGLDRPAAARSPAPRRGPAGGRPRAGARHGGAEPSS